MEKGDLGGVANAGLATFLDQIDQDEVMSTNYGYGFTMRSNELLIESGRIYWDL